MRRLATAAGRLWLAATVAMVGGLAATSAVGWDLRAVTTASMEPAVQAGSLAVIAPVSSASLEVGDVIAFKRQLGGGRVLHRIVGVHQRDVSPLLMTQGDANPEPDPIPTHPSRVEGRLIAHLPAIGHLAALARPPLGLAVLGGGPLGVLALIEISRWRHRRRTRAVHVAVEGLGAAPATGGG